MTTSGFWTKLRAYLRGIETYRDAYDWATEAGCEPTYEGLKLHESNLFLR